MRNDPYILNRYNNEFQGDKDIEDYHCGWSKFLSLVRRISDGSGMMPGEKRVRYLFDINCWLLLFHGYRKERDTRIGHVIIDSLDENVEEVDEETFKYNVKTLYTAFHFDLKSFYEVWEYQHNIKRLLRQIVRKEFLIGNRFAPAVKRRYKPRYQLICHPTEYDDLPVPKTHRILDGLIFPVIITKNNGNYKTERLELTNFGEGDFITCNGEVIDCIRINDFWQTRNHLKQRLAFSFLVETDYDEAPMIICNNMTDIAEAWKLIGANQDDGILVRSLGENLYQNYWLLLNKDSAFVAAYTKTGYSLDKRVVNKRGFVTLEGRHIGTMEYTDTALKQMRWLDQYDLARFKKIVFQDEDYHIGGDILKENNKKDMRPEFDFGVFNEEELMKMNDDFDWDNDIDWNDDGYDDF